MIDGTEPPPDRHGIADISAYLDDVTSEHNQQPNYVELLIALLQPFGDITWLETHFFQYYDLDLAIGAQLDAVGEWVGRTRFLTVPINAYFSWDIVGLGWNQANWKRPFDADTGIVALDDEHYRILLRAVIAANHWDGTIPGAYATYEKLFAGTGFTIGIQDFGDMTMGLILFGPHTSDQITLALFDTGELDLKPAGIGMDHYYPTVWPGGPGGTPVFGFDVMDTSIAGWDVGAWATTEAPFVSS